LGQLGEDVGDLEAARQAQPVDLERLLAVDAVAVQQHLPAAGREAAADEVEQRGLAGAVGADHGDALALVHLQAAAADDLRLAEALAQVLEFEGGGHSVLRRAAPRRTPPPRGAAPYTK
jgi:uncharacterized protein involved in propanediol utilization